MKLFHGTSYKLGNKILEQGLIKKGQSAFDIVTDSNYIYLTDRITVAMGYGRKKSLHLQEKEFYLFELELKEDLLLVDLDEVAIFKNGFRDQKAAIEKLNGQFTVENTLPLFYSVRVDFDIALHNYTGKYSTLSIQDMAKDINEDIFDKNLTKQDLQKIYDSITWHSI
ncbi:hypothetical protein PDK35_19700 [Bacillus cereus group sp. TH153LC]|uniref:hypothetical protein n=1 Tax=Bacillus cereus group sp. TH153LC TaxID=3018059 RepID=UPI0022E473EE|nr:hypothetical protein [Bacillus cereus group sp. TH153LC]MDA1662165.1 hypothetical protein [Bacillus cereus group sp. TH153LC]